MAGGHQGVRALGEALWPEAKGVEPGTPTLALTPGELLGCVGAGWNKGRGQAGVGCSAAGGWEECSAACDGGGQVQQVGEGLGVHAGGSGKRTSCKEEAAVSEQEEEVCI